MIFATKSARIGQSADVLSGDVVVNEERSSSPTLDTGFELSVEPQAVTPDNFAVVVDRLRVKSKAIVNSDVFTNTLTSNGTINGNVTTPVALPFFAASQIPPFETGTPGASDVTVPRNGTQTLTPGNYRNIVVNQGGTLTFTGGTYSIQSLTTQNRAKLLFNAFSEVRVQQRFFTGRDVQVGPSTSSSIFAADIIFYVNGTNGGTGQPISTPAAATIGERNTVNANFYVPNGTLYIQKATNATGAFLGQHVLIDNDAQISLHSAFGDDSPGVTTTTPADGATGVPTDTDLTITFSEPIDVTGNWFQIGCGTSGTRNVSDTTVTPNSDQTSFTINPTTDFASGESCTVTVFAAEVTDQDTDDPPNNMAENFTFTFTMDTAPNVTSTTPTNGATGVAVDANLAITFSEAVNVVGNWFQIECGASGTRNVADTVVTGGPTSFTIDPTTNFAGGESCMVTVSQAQVTDQDTNDPPDNMAADFVFTFVTANAAPVVNPATFSLAENSANGTSVGTVTVSDDVGQAHTFAITAGNTGDAFAINTNTGEITIATSTALDFETTPTFTLTVQATDNATPPLSGTGTITVNLTDANDAPVVTAATFSLPENSVNGTNVGTVTFTDEAGQNHTFAITGGNTNGAFAINSGTGQITVANSTALDFETTPTFSLTVEVTDDGSPAQSGSATITVSLTDVNEAPTATPQSVTTDEDVATAITLAGTDPENQTLTFATTNPTKGVLSGTAPNLTYTPNANENGSDSFTFTVSDGTTASAPATVSITITPVDDPPVANSDSTTVTEDAGATAVNVLGNDTDIDGGPISVFSVTQPANGTVINNGSHVTYQPDANYCNSLSGTPDTFGYTLTPGGSAATVSVIVTCVNDAPVAEAKSGIVIQANMKRESINASLLSGVTDADTGVDGCTPTFAVASITANTGGTVSGVDLDNGTFDFDPAPGFTGTAVVNYTVSDDGCPGTATSAPATISLTVNGPVIWFVNPVLGTNGDGRLSNPFNNLASASAVDAANHRIFIYTGSTTGGISLETNEWLIGQGVSGASFDAVFGITPPSGTIARPSVGGTRPSITHSATNLALGSGNMLRGFNLSNTGGTALTGSSFGNLTVSDVSVSNSNGVGINLNNGTPNASFTSVSTSGGGNGIILQNWASGSFTITGSGGSCSMAAPTCTGGTIASTTGPNSGSVPVTGTGILLNNVTNISLSNVRVRDHSNYGIRGNSVTNFTLTDSLIDATAPGFNGDDPANEDGSLYFTNLLGTSSISGSDIRRGLENLLQVDNTSGTLTLNITNSNFQDTDLGTMPLVGNAGIHLLARTTATMTVNVSNTDVKNVMSDCVLGRAQDSGTLNLTVTGGNLLDSDEAFDLAVSQNGDMTYDINGVTMTGHTQNTVQVVITEVTNLSNVTGRIRNNTIGNADIVGSGSELGFGINMDLRGNGTSNQTIHNNVISHTDREGILIGVRGESSEAIKTGQHQLRITSNTITTPDDNSAFPFGDINGIELETNNGQTFCLNISGNESRGAGNCSSPICDGYRLRQRNQGAASVFQIQGLTPASGATAAQVETYVEGQNPGTVAPADTCTVQPASGTTIVAYTAATCTTPTP